MAFQGLSSSSLFPFSRGWTYDVFLSFRGKDTRQNFTAHLHDALDRKKINTYIDCKLRIGEKISEELLKAIDSSRISIVVLSKNYASSTWCLEELVKIIECKEKKQQMVLPVFYHVDPSDVRYQTKSFGEALAKLKDQFKDETKVQNWKVALTEVANLSGFTLGDKNEPKFIEEIVRKVSRSIKPKYLNEVAKHPVGMEPRVHDVHDILQIEGVNDLRILGIYGIGGVGKTNLAKEIYNLFTNQFEYCCFLANVRETSKSKYGLIQLHERLLCTILEDPNLNVRSVDERIGLIKKLLWSKRVLLVLDDLDRSVNVKRFLDGFNGFGLGSIIIITTRDEHLLTSYNVHLRYKVKELDHDEALRLFCWNAFEKENPNYDFVELIENVLHYAGGLPLALIVLGSSLRKRDIHYWRSSLEKYKRIPHDYIQGILRTSYDNLEESEKNIFLDIACFFTGKRVEYVTKIHNACDFFPDTGIQELIDKSLITIDEFHKLAMHDLLRDMGREIVRQESKEPGKRSRLWFHQDVRDVLEEGKGTNEIQGMLIELPKQDMINLNPKAFFKMTNLRIFINRNACFSREPNYLSNKLRLLDWYGYPGHSFPRNFHGKNLIVLRMNESLIKDLGDTMKDFLNLKTMKFSECSFLTKIPDVSGLQNLERLIICSCKNLVEVHQSIGFLDKLIKLSIKNCHNLTSFPRSLKLRSLKRLDVSFCKRLQNFPEIEIEMKCLTILRFQSNGIKELPSSIRNLTELQEMNLSHCLNLRHIPNSILELQNLSRLYLSGWIDKRKYPLPSIAEILFSSLPPMNSSISNDRYRSSIVFPKFRHLNLCKWPLSELDYALLTACYPTLISLDLSGSNVVTLSDWIKGFVQLRVLKLVDCKQLKEILELPPNIEELDASGCISLESFPEVSKKFEFDTSNFRWLRSIILSGCHKMLVNPLQFEENLEDHPYCELVYPGNKIPDWDYHYKKTLKGYVSEINVYLLSSNEIEGIITCVVVELDPSSFIQLEIYYNGVVSGGNIISGTYVSMGLDHVMLDYHKLNKERFKSVEGSLQIKYRSVLGGVQIKSFGVRMVRKQKEINTFQDASWSPCINVQLSMRHNEDNDLENEIDSEVGVRCEGSIFNYLSGFVYFLETIHGQGKDCWHYHVINMNRRMQDLNQRLYKVQ